MKKLRDQKIIVMFSDNKQHNDRCESFKKKSVITLKAIRFNLLGIQD